MHSMGYDSPIVITRTRIKGGCNKSVDYRFTAGGVHHTAHKTLCCGFDPITTSSDPSRDMGINVPLCPGLCGPWADVTDGSGGWTVGLALQDRLQGARRFLDDSFVTVCPHSLRPPS